MVSGVMNAIVRERSGVRLRSVAVPEPPSGWVRLHVRMVGLCRTDLAAASGALPVAEGRILGHEVVGELDGTRVTVAPMVPCGGCSGCLASRRCTRPGMIGLSHDGAFATWLCAPLAQIHPVPSTLPLRRAAFVEPIAASLAVLRAPIHPSDRGVVLGNGRIGALTRRILAEHGFSRVEGDDAHEDAAFDFVIETDATEATLARALDLVRPGGVIVLKSRPVRAIPIDVTRAVLADVRFASVGYGSFGDAIELAARLPIDDLLAEPIPCERFREAFELAAEPRSPKRFLVMGDG